MTILFFDKNYYSSDNNFDYFALLALLVSLISVFITIRAVYLAKKEEIRYKHFEELCLNPVKDELERIYVSLNSNSLESLPNLINEINKAQREFALLLTRIRRIFKNIDVDEIQNLYLDFSDLCFEKPAVSKVGDIINDYQSLRVEILDLVYRYALKQTKFLL